MILNQTRTGKPCPKDIAQLRSALPPANESYMCYVRVHALNLSIVLDRLEALEDFQAQALKLHHHLSVD